MTFEEKVDALCKILGIDDNSRTSDKTGFKHGNYEDAVRHILFELGSPEHLIGYEFAVKAILLAIEDRTYINKIYNGLYPRVAAEFNTTGIRVERAIRHLVEVTWIRGDCDVLNKYFGNIVNPQKGKPTNGEFIARMANIVKKMV